MVFEIFEVVLGGIRSFHVLVLTNRFGGKICDKE